MDEEQLQEFLRTQSSAAGAPSWQMGEGGAGLPAPSYTNNGTYLSSTSNTTNTPATPTGPRNSRANSAYYDMRQDAQSMYEQSTPNGRSLTPPTYNNGGNARPSTTSNDYENTGRFDMRPSAIYNRRPEASNNSEVPTNNNRNEGLENMRNAANSIYETGTDLLGNNIVGEGINTLGNLEEVTTNAARNYTSNSINSNLAELNRPGTTATNLAEAQAIRETSNVVAAEEMLARNPSLATASETARTITRYMPVAGLYLDGTGLYDNVTGTGSAENLSNEEQAYNIALNGTGLVSSTIGTGALVGEGLAASSTGLLGELGTGLVGALGEGTVLGGTGAVAGTAAALLAAGAGGYALGTAYDRETHLSEHIARGAINLTHGDPEYGPNVRGFRRDDQNIAPD